MKISHLRLLTLISTVSFMALFNHSIAAVFVCLDNDCNTWAPITNAQYSTASSDEKNTTLRVALGGTSEPPVINGFNSLYNTDLYIKNSMWHTGGIEPFKGIQHVTAYVYKSTDPSKRLHTCHIFSIKNPSGAYHATCVKAQ